jgi:hypothetical protein
LLPNSYQTLTVPVYNTTRAPTNSKTYYPTYSNGSVNSNLSSPLVVDQIGTQTPTGTPPVAEPVVTQITSVEMQEVINANINAVGGGGSRDSDISIGTAQV